MPLTDEDVIRHEKLSRDPGRIRHAWFTRKGGVSQGIYAGLNLGLGSDDNMDHVIENRQRAARYMGVEDHERFLAPIQVHSPNVWTVSERERLDDRIRADAVVTRTPGVPIAIGTADCGPVLFADFENSVVGAAHAGWKGATGGVLEATIEAMLELGARRDKIITVLGPSISQKNYEVGPEYADNLLKMDADNSTWLVPSDKADHFRFDLRGYTVNRLKNNNIDACMTDHCTYEDEELFFSYRRTTHRGEPDYGRQLAAITLLDK